jgi:hypothetical protein
VAFRINAAGRTCSRVEKAGDGAFVGDAADRLAEQRRDGQSPDLAILGISLARPDGVGDDQLAQLRLGDARRRSARQHAVGAVSENLGRALLLERRCRVAQRTRGIDDVVDEYAGAAFDVADDVHYL